MNSSVAQLHVSSAAISPYFSSHGSFNSISNVFSKHFSPSFAGFAQISASKTVYRHFLSSAIRIESEEATLYLHKKISSRLFENSAKCFISHCLFDNCITEEDGGAIFCRYNNGIGTLKVDHSTFKECKATNGGAIKAYVHYFNFSKSCGIQNTATAEGSFLFVYTLNESLTSYMDSISMTRCSASDVYGISVGSCSVDLRGLNGTHCTSTNRLSVTNFYTVFSVVQHFCLFTDNTSPNTIYVRGGQVSDIFSNVFIDNTATGVTNPGLIQIGSNTSASHCVFINNKGSLVSLWNSASKMTFIDCIFTGSKESIGVEYERGNQFNVASPVTPDMQHSLLTVCFNYSTPLFSSSLLSYHQSFFKAVFIFMSIIESE